MWGLVLAEVLDIHWGFGSISLVGKGGCCDSAVGLQMAVGIVQEIDV